MLYHFILAAIHAASAAVMFFSGNARSVDIHLSGRIYSRLDLLTMNGVFLAFTAAAHFTYGTGLLDSINWRWVEYGFSASIMAVEIALLSGVTDLIALISIFGLMATTMQFGRMQDQVYARRVKNIAPFWRGLIPYTFAWGAITWQFTDTITSNKKNTPAFVWGIFFSTFCTFSTFAAVQYWHVVRGQLYQKVVHFNNDTMLESQDRYMHILSVASKLLLAFWMYGGIVIGSN
jgi:hypothetical protein